MQKRRPDISASTPATAPFRVIVVPSLDDVLKQIRDLPEKKPTDAQHHVCSLSGRACDVTDCPQITVTN